MKLVLGLSLLFSTLTFAEINIDGKYAQKLMESIETIGKIEKVDLTLTQDNFQYVQIDLVTCVFENYNACTFGAQTANGRKLVIATDGTAGFMDAMSKAGINVDEEYATMDADEIYCTRTGTEYTCSITEAQPREH